MHFSNPKPVWRKLIPVLVFGALCAFAACENDLDAIKKIANMNSGLAIDTTRAVDVIYSDSAIVKGRLQTPLLIKYSGEKAYDVMPDGVKILVFGKKGEQEATIVADSAVHMETENLSKFYRNVKVTTSDGSTFRSEELFWDQPKKLFYTNSTFELMRPNGDVQRGTGYKGADDLSNADWEQGTGAIETPENLVE